VDKNTTKDKLLAAGLKVIHRNGFASSSVRDVVAAAGVSQGSFTQHFKSKEDFGLQVIALYTKQGERLVAATLGNTELSPLARLRGFLEGDVSSSKRDDNRCGCMYGNFSAEADSAGELIRQEICRRLAEREAAVAACLAEAVAAGELPASIDVAATAGFVISALQGALLRAKVERSGEPLAQLVHLLFGTLFASRP
jgi:TetR/AcrR family transcriptional repressor of nem operon